MGVLSQRTVDEFARRGAMLTEVRNQLAARSA